MENRDTITVGEAARRLAVSVATIKRWVERGLLAAERTDGGHRRVLLSDLHRLLEERTPRKLNVATKLWLTAMFGADIAKVVSLLDKTHRQHRSWIGVSEHVASVVAKLGQTWEVGDCKVYEEQVASETLYRALVLTSSKFRRRVGKPRALLLTVEGERHTLGLALAELVLKEAGWNPIWIGEGPPVSEVLIMIKRLRPKLVVLTGTARLPRRLVASYQAALYESAQSMGAELLVAGDAAWSPGDCRHLAENFSRFGEILAELKPRMTQ